MFVSVLNSQSDKNEENINSSVINTVASVSLSAQETWNNCVPPSSCLLLGEWRTATSCKTLQFGQIIHSTYRCWNTRKRFAAGHVKWEGLLLDGTGAAVGVRVWREGRKRGDGSSNLLQKKGLINGGPLGKTHQLWGEISTNTKRKWLSLL